MRDLKGKPGTHNDDCDDDDDDDDDEKEGDEILPPIQIKRECQQDHEDGVDLSDSTIDKNNEELVSFSACLPACPDMYQLLFLLSDK